ncbi:TPA: hypothetical protein NG675_004972 [Vibrio parahaemolyticus]|nr:hypothetical protein [Vibrio parahaemolyticus]HCE2814413.1 hypothetical protein [Vibrio parahaemolyticus]HCE2818708.1 hypothetical protein [Vibrio parahaemolyticus]HCG5303163.1 hypothetical protein [Vibrio parahaemolyticus]HCG5307356.1 hypothetical protein [Vibrio parahaemolyticus]
MELIFDSAIVAKNNEPLYLANKVIDIIKLKYEGEEVCFIKSLLPKLCSLSQINQAMSLVKQKRLANLERREEIKREIDLYHSYLESLIGNRTALRNQQNNRVYLLPEGNYPSRKFVDKSFVDELPNELANLIKSDMNGDDIFILEDVNTFNYLALIEV